MELVVSMQWITIVEMKQYMAAIYIEQFNIPTRVQLLIFRNLVIWESTAIWSKAKAAFLGKQNLHWETVWGWSNSHISCSYAIGKNFSVHYRKILRTQKWLSGH